MIKAADLPDILPIFRLPGVLLLPRSRMPLHIFEPRYLQMLDDILKTSERLIGMIQPHETRDGNDAGLQAVGCAGRLIQFSETEDRRYMITLSGISRFRVLSEETGFTPYQRCSICWDGYARDLGREEKDGEFDRPAFLELLGRYFAARDLSADWVTLKKAEDEMLVNSLSMLLDFDPEEKQALLEAPSLAVRRQTLTTLIEFKLRSGEGEELMQ